MNNADLVEVNGTWRHTHNSLGKLIHPTLEGIIAFWKWFGESKVVDKQGRPLVVYHGTKRTFDSFDLGQIGTGTGNFGHYGYGFYFSPDRREASHYGRNVVSAYMSLKNPWLPTEQNYLRLKMAGVDTVDDLVPLKFDLDDLVKKVSAVDRIAGKWAKACINSGGAPEWDPTYAKSKIDLNHINDWIKLDGDREIPKYMFEEMESAGIAKVKTIVGFEYAQELHWITKLGAASKEVTDIMKKLGHDGVIYGSECVAFKSTQIKSATGNRGTFDPSDPVITNPPSSFPVLPYSSAHKWEPLAAKRGVSEVARSSRGFMRAYQRVGSWARLPEEWKRKRNGFVARHMAQVRQNREPLWKDGQPTRRGLALLMWAYMPPRR